MTDSPTDPRPNSSTENETRAKPDRGGPDSEPPGPPRWLWIFGIIGIVLALLVVIMMFAGGDHGPARHIPTAHFGVDRPSTAYSTEYRVQSP